MFSCPLFTCRQSNKSVSRDIYNAGVGSGRFTGPAPKSVLSRQRTSLLARVYKEDFSPEADSPELYQQPEQEILHPHFIT